MKKLRKAISAGVPVKAVRDVTNRLRFGPDAPQSDELIWIRPRDVTHWYAADPTKGAPRFRRRHSGSVVAGDWDKSRTPFAGHIKLDSIRAHFEQGVPWEETELFDWMLQRIEELGRIDGVTDRAGLIRRYERL